MLKKLLERLTQPASEPAPKHLVALAAAALLLEVSWADHEITDAELAVIERALRSQFGFDETEVAELIDQSRRDHDQSVGLYGYTRVINEHWDEPARFELVLALWRLAMSDDELDRYEEHTIRKVAELLYLSHDRFIEAKLRARQSD